jgi:hypothetical protein
MLLVNCQGEVVDASPSAVLRFGGGQVGREALLHRPLNQLMTRTWQRTVLQGLDTAFQTGRGMFPARLRRPGGHGLDIVLTIATLRRTGEGLALAFVRRPAKPGSAATARAEIEQLFIQNASCQAFLGSAALCLQRLTGCECAGIRILDDEGNIPYGASQGFSPEFLQLENRLSIRRDNCVCIRVITGDYEVQDLPIVSEAGSFLVNDPGEYVLELHPILQREYRSVCLQVGFKSIAAIPLRDNGRVLGAIHITDRRPGMLPPEMVMILEAAAARVGEAIHQYAQIEQISACFPTLE